MRRPSIADRAGRGAAHLELALASTRGQQFFMKLRPTRAATALITHAPCSVELVRF